MGNRSSFVLDIGKGISIALGTPKISTWDFRTRPKKVNSGVIGLNTQTNTIELFDGKKWLVAFMEESS